MSFKLENKEEILSKLCQKCKKLIQDGEYEECYEILRESLKKFPDEPHPHNLLGILLEKKGEHNMAMKHFRASQALDSSYKPTIQNLITYGTSNSNNCCAYDENDCHKEETIFQNCFTKKVE